MRSTGLPRWMLQIRPIHSIGLLASQVALLLWIRGELSSVRDEMQNLRVRAQPVTVMKFPLNIEGDFYWVDGSFEVPVGNPTAGTTISGCTFISPGPRAAIEFIARSTNSNSPAE
jgi:hypothetical protein